MSALSQYTLNHFSNALHRFIAARHNRSTMNHFRDTQYGHLVRFLSAKRLLRHPDEVDSTVWEDSTRHGNVQVARQTQKGNSDLEKSTDTSPPLDTSTESPDVQAVSTDGLRAVEAGKDVCLVDWYGSDDPEVGGMSVIVLTNH